MSELTSETNYDDAKLVETGVDIVNEVEIPFVILELPGNPSDQVPRRKLSGDNIPLKFREQVVKDYLDKEEISEEDKEIAELTSTPVEEVIVEDSAEPELPELKA